MRKFVAIFLIALVFSLVGCSDKSEDFKNDESYFVGDWTATTGRILVSTGSQLPTVGAEIVYSFQTGGKMSLKSPFLVVPSGQELAPASPGSITLTKPESLWSYVSGNKQLLLFLPRKTVYDVIRVDKNNFTAIDVETSYQLKFARK